MKVALICFDNPFLPPAEGGKKGMMSRIESLKLLDDCEIDLFIHNKESEGFASLSDEDKTPFRQVYQYKMNKGWKQLFRRYPVCVGKRFVGECVNTLQKNHYDFAIYEGEQVAAYRLENCVNADHHILYMHDIESVYRSELARSQNNPALKIANAIEAQKFQAIESKIPDAFDRLWFVSVDECRQFAETYSIEDKCVYIPFPALHISSKAIGTTAYNRLLYVGDMTIKHNFLSVLWFTENVFLPLKTQLPHIEFRVIGRIPPSGREQLQERCVTVCGYVDDIDQEYANAACIVCPVLYGAGVKVKTIDALAHGQIVITNKKGIEGTSLINGRHLLVGESAEELKAFCIGALTEREAYSIVSNDGLAYIAKEHTISNQANIIRKEFFSLSN